MVVNSWTISRQYRLLLVLMAVMGLWLSPAEAGNPVTVGLSHKYSIYCSSEEDSTELNRLYGSYIEFKLKPSVGAMYDFYVRDDLHIAGRVDSYQETAHGLEYVLEGFFLGKYRALLKILDMESCDNLKVAVISYANTWEDQKGDTAQLYILIDGDDEVRQFNQLPSINKMDLR